MMKLRSVFLSCSVAVSAIGGLAGCGAAETASEVEEGEEAFRLLTCANVRCASGTHCVETKHSVSCKPNKCGPNTKMCIKGTHYDNTPGVCTCVADECGPNTKLCMIGTHYDNTPGVCTCVPDAATAECKTDADCRVEADYCTGCNCSALAKTESIPACSGPGVRCLVDPCSGKSAVCSSGQCVVK